MGREDIAAGQAKQVKGKINDVVGAIKGDTAQQIKGKAQAAVGKVQEKLGQPRGAYNLLQSVLEEHPDNIEARISLAEASRRLRARNSA